MKKVIIVVLIALLGGILGAADNKQVMPAKRRAQIVATAKALFEPQVKSTLKIGKVRSPFTTVAAP